MSVEERLARALHDEVDTLDVDVQRLHARTRSRLGTRPPASPRPSRTWVPLLAVAAVLLVVAGGLALNRLGDTVRTIGPAGDSHRGGVAAAFTCPRQITVDDAGRKRDDSFLPSLDQGAAAAADFERAPRYDYDETGDRATLRLGNADGSLASTANFARTSDGWDLITTTKCAGEGGGILVPEADPLRLGRRDFSPYPARGMTEQPDKAVLVDDRGYYDVAGLVHHRTMWASPCEGDTCLSAGRPTSHVIWTPDHPRGLVPEDLTTVLLPPDDSVGRPNPYAFWAVLDPDGSVVDVHGTSSRGIRTDAVRIEGPGWKGRLYLLLQRKDALDTVVVRTANGSTSYPTR